MFKILLKFFKIIELANEKFLWIFWKLASLFTITSIKSFEAIKLHEKTVFYVSMNKTDVKNFIIEFY